MRIELDGTVRRTDEGTLVGGSPRRIMRLSTSGQLAIEELLHGRAESAAARLLGRRLIDAGIAHPRPKPRDPSGLVTVVIPVRDRPHELARCVTALASDAAVIVVDDESRDGEAIARVLAAKDGVRLVRSERCGGPGAARNAALRFVETELVAFLDSDCVPSSGWLDRLVGHFEDPVVGAVAPRVRPSTTPRSAIGRYLQSRSPLDMGTRASAVQLDSRVAYLPSAALLVRRAALGGGFDERLRYGEDVDLVWRMNAAGWRIRYDPSTTVEHEEPNRLHALAQRRFRYGTSAAKLLARHPGRLSAARLHPAAVAGAGMLLTRRPGAAATLVAADAVRSLIHMRRRGLPVWLGVRWIAEAIAKTLLAMGRPAATLGLPIGVMICLRRRPREILGLMALPALVEWCNRRPQLDPLRWIVLATIDDLAYVLGVCQGCIESRDGRALLPTFAWRLRDSARSRSPGF